MEQKIVSSETLKSAVAAALCAVHEKCPLVHNITNYVTVNDCANALLAIGASPIMTDEVLEVEEIVSIASSLVLNIGTLNERTVQAMCVASKRANEKGVPIVFDPVGAGASSYRNEVTLRLLHGYKISILRGNLSEISFIAGISAATKGVDVSEKDLKNNPLTVAQTVAEKYGCTVVITGKEDTVCDGKRVAFCKNGHAMLSKVTGTGCMTSAITGGYAGATSDMFVAALAGVCSMGIAGETAFEKVGSLGSGSFHSAIIDSLFGLNQDVVLNRAALYEN